jgi:hypothetical protein
VKSSFLHFIVGLVLGGALTASLITTSMWLGKFDYSHQGAIVGEIKPGMEVTNDIVNVKKRNEDKVLSLEKSRTDRTFELLPNQRTLVVLVAVFMGLVGGSLVARLRWVNVNFLYLVGAGVSACLGQLTFGYILESLIACWIAQPVGYKIMAVVGSMKR